LLEETDFTEPFPAGVLQTVDELACNPVKEEPAVRTPESAAAEPTVITGVVPAVVDVVTPSKLHAASTSGTGGLKRLSGSMKLFLTIVPELPALSWTCLTLPVETARTEPTGYTASAIAKMAESAAPINGMKRDFEADRGVDLDIRVPLVVLT